MFGFYRLFYTLFSVTLWGILTWWFIYRHDYNYIFKPGTGLLYIGYVFAAAGLLLISLSIIKYGLGEFFGLNAFNKAQQAENAPPELNTGGMNAFVGRAGGLDHFRPEFQTDEGRKYLTTAHLWLTPYNSLL